ncbi:MAG: DUF899 domain-containing protein [Burkholderiales bacterium]|nr:DUF899 domain-containing protein [Burkholderiales bacterium]
MTQFHNHRFPGEGADYRDARDKLLELEIDLRTRIEAVAALRRGLPRGGALKEDYVFEEGAVDLSDRQTIKQTRFSELFMPGKNSLIIYSFMYSADDDTPCPMCTSLLDSLNGTAPHAGDRVNLAVVGKATIRKIRQWAQARYWTNLRLLSSNDNTYNKDYHAEDDDGNQWPAINVFRKESDGIHHFYNAELFYAPTAEGQHPRHADLIWPLWNLFDLTPEGRGTNWFPKYHYDP